MAMKSSGVIVAGLALFSMFFGAGDLIWPLILGGASGDCNFFAMLGLLITGVTLPFLGLMAMMLFEGDTRAFFGQTGPRMGWLLLCVIQLILGPLGTTPRLITLSYATLKPYLFEGMTLGHFSVLSALVIFVFTLRKSRVVNTLGIILCPMLLLTLGSILVMGFIQPLPEPAVMALESKQAFWSGLNVGYNTLDIIASFIFAPLVLSYFTTDGGISSRREVFKKMVKASTLAALLLGGMYIGLTYIASYYTPLLPAHLPEERLAALSLFLLGPYGAFFSCIAVALSCLTTAIPIAMISAEFLHRDVTRGKLPMVACSLLALALSMGVANVGFMGIAEMLSPILQILCPGLIILSLLNIFHKLYEMRMRKMPVFAAFALSTIGYFLR